MLGAELGFTLAETGARSSRAPGGRAGASPRPAAAQAFPARFLSHDVPALPSHKSAALWLCETSAGAGLARIPKEWTRGNLNALGTALPEPRGVVEYVGIRKTTY